MSPRNVDSPLRHLTEAVSMQKRLVERDPADALLHHELGGMYNNLASARKSVGWTMVSKRRTCLRLNINASNGSSPEMPDYRSFLDTHLLNYRKLVVDASSFRSGDGGCPRASRPVACRRSPPVENSHRPCQESARTGTKECSGKHCLSACPVGNRNAFSGLGSGA